jgi:hypothetical protein
MRKNNKENNNKKNNIHCAFRIISIYMQAQSQLGQVANWPTSTSK